MNIVTIILFGESSKGEVSADLSIVPVDEEADDEDDIRDGEVEDADDEDDNEVVLEAGELELPDDAEVVGVVELEVDEPLGEPAEVAAGEVDEDEVEAVERADERDELLSDKADEVSAKLAGLSCCEQLAVVATAVVRQVGLAPPLVTATPTFCC